MTGMFYHWAKAEAGDFAKKDLDYSPETTSFPVTESTRDGCTA